MKRNIVSVGLFNWRVRYGGICPVSGAGGDGFLEIRPVLHGVCCDRFLWSPSLGRAVSVESGARKENGTAEQASGATRCSVCKISAVNEFITEG